MDIALFLKEFQELLQRDDPVQTEDVLVDLEEWDSLAIMACIAYFDKKFGKKTNVGTFRDLHSVADVFALAAGTAA